MFEAIYNACCLFAILTAGVQTPFSNDRLSNDPSQLESNFCFLFSQRVSHTQKSFQPEFLDVFFIFRQNRRHSSNILFYCDYCVLHGHFWLFFPRCVESPSDCLQDPSLCQALHCFPQILAIFCIFIEFLIYFRKCFL